MSPLEILRHQAHDCLSKYLYSSAAFLADKIVTMSGGLPCDVLLLAQAFLAGGSPRRALSLIRRQLEAADAWPKSGEVLWEKLQKGGAAKQSADEPNRKRSLGGVSAAAAREAIEGFNKTPAGGEGSWLFVSRHVSHPLRCHVWQPGESTISMCLERGFQSVII